ncbi:MAG TPA: phosphotransferase [Kribbella sp.]
MTSLHCCCLLIRPRGMRGSGTSQRGSRWPGSWRRCIGEAFRATPDSFLHGDCHVDNLLREGNQIVWADWQAAGAGSPAGDLAFLWSRAQADGADLPYDAMLREYVTHREVDPALLRRSLVAAEIGILLFGWPAYAAYLTQSDRDRITRRLLQLMDDWQKQTRRA